ncbi:MAG: NADH-quinone oxidoreductase subunit L [Burkholderiaceae bacterium]|jgi:NADH-quinone oxidoreductase subunit L|nr:NADH-quinone oxidoreductase subunit L [Burkholderiaceae bacterium]
MEPAVIPFVLPLIPLLPLAGALLIGLPGTILPGRRVGRRAVWGLVVASLLLSFACSLYLLPGVADGSRFYQRLYLWGNVGSVPVEIGFMADKVVAIMIVVVTLVSLLVSIYALEYMREEAGYHRFFALLLFFVFAMLLLVMSGNLLQLFFGWEAVGLASYLLIGFWGEKPAAAAASLKAFLVNRLGDVGFIVGIGILFSYAGTLQYNDIFRLREFLTQTTLPGTDWSVLTVACLCLFAGVMAKSAQFPLHIWLPDSMEGPTPVSALIHAATMVTAGIFVVLQLHPLFELSGTTLSLMLLTGTVTALLMGAVAVVKHDIKQIIAYSTLSQLGYMTAALGVSATAASFFHLVTHAFFKALLFLVAGSVILGMNHDQDIRHMGGLRRDMPWTCCAAWVAALSSVGFPFLSGFYSKESILSALAHAPLPGAGLAYGALLLTVFITAVYTFRLLFVVFHGETRFDGPYPVVTPDGATTEVGLPAAEKPREAPRMILLPLGLLALPSALWGIAAEGFSRHAAAGPGGLLLAMAQEALFAPAVWLMGAGILLAWYCYVANPALPGKLAGICRPLHALLKEHYYFDAVDAAVCAGKRGMARLSAHLTALSAHGEHLIARAAFALGKALWRAGDVRLIDGVMVNGSAWLVCQCAKVVRRTQSGYLYHYAFVMIAGLLCLLLYLVPAGFA